METRKQLRIEDYDYSRNGAYFITVCVKDRQLILSEIILSTVGASIASPPEVKVSWIGKIVESAIEEIPNHYENVLLDRYVIMPDHIHLLLRIENENGRAMLAPTASTSVSEIVRQMKGYVTKQCGRAIWQRSYYDHIIRNEQDYLEIWQYIEGNPSKWRKTGEEKTPSK